MKLTKAAWISITISLSIVMIASGFVSRDEVSSDYKAAIATPTPSSALEEMRDTFPSVNYTSSLMSTRDVQRSEKYDKSLRTLNPDIDKDEEAVSGLAWWQNLSALPIEKSSIVVIGKIRGSSASLSTSKNTVYSKFNISVEKVLKWENRPKDTKELLVEREGGVVVYPSGHKVWVRLAGQRMPVTGRRYVFFVSSDFPLLGYQKDDFCLLTAYELTDGKVLPLDSPYSRTFSSYEGTTERSLIRDLESCIRAHKEKSP